jgi:hypothetical protein
MRRRVVFAAVAITTVAWGSGAAVVLLGFVGLAWLLVYSAAIGGEWLRNTSRARFDGHHQR